MIKKVSVFLIAVLLFVTCGTGYRVKASGGYYEYKEIAEGNGSSRKVWFVNGEEISGNPSVIEQDSNIIIDVTPDDSCAAYLATFYEPTVRVTVNPGVTVTFGSESTKTSIQGLTCYDANVTIYAEEGGFKEDGSLPGSVYGVTCFNSKVNIYGNVQYLCLGDEFTYGDAGEKVNTGDVVVNGSVYSVECHTTSKYTQGGNGTEYYRGFKGNASVSGKVGRISVYEIRHSNVLGEDIKATIGEGHDLPFFKMTNGTISSEIKSYINTYNPDMENFYYQYSPIGDGNWVGIARYLDGGETQYQKNVTTEEIKTILENGTGRLSLDRDDSINVDIGNHNISELKIQSGGITVNNVTANGKGLLQVTSYAKDRINVNVNGDVDKCIINFTRFNENMNINVKGTVKDGQVNKFSLQSDFPIYLGEFTCTDMPIFVNGVWNPDLFLSLGAAEYHPVDDALLDEALGLKKNIIQGSDKISEMVDMVVEEVKTESLDELESNSEFNKCVDQYGDVDVLTGVDITLEKFDYNETTGEVSNQEVVTELVDNKDLSITVKVPEHDYDADKEYVIVREHDNHGKKEMDVLVPKKHGDKLTFKTNKFSSFIIVEVSGDKKTEDKPVKPTEGTTEKPTEGTTEKPTEGETEKPTEGETEKPTEGETEKSTEETTEKTTEDETELETTEISESTSDIEDDSDGGDKKSGNKPVVWWIVGILGVIGVATAVGIILFKKNKMKNTDGE